MTEPLESPGPGWAALDAALGALPALAGPFRFDVRAPGGEPPPIDGLSVLPRDGGWHYVTYGLTELYEKASPDAATSGFGFELTLRLPRARGEGRPPDWPAQLLRAVAAYVVETGERLEPGHHVDVGGPIGPGAALCAALVVDDPELAPVQGPFGGFRFLQLVGLHADELELLADWSPEGVRDLLARADPLLVTRADRPSLLADPAEAARIRARVDAEGSSLDALWAPLAVRKDGPRALVELEPDAVPALRRLLAGRLAHGRPARLDGPEGALLLEPAAAPRWRFEGDALVLALPPETARAFRDELAEQPGGPARQAFQDLWVRIVPAGR